MSTQTYYAKSAYSDPANWINFITGLIALLMLPDNGIPPQYAKYLAIISASLNLFVRTFVTERPVGLNIAPGDAKPVEVKTLESK